MQYILLIQLQLSNELSHYNVKFIIYQFKVKLTLK